MAIKPSKIAEDLAQIKLDRALRPNTLDEMVGQADFKERIKIAIQAAKEREEPIPHILLTGPAGYGKTTLSNVITNDYGSKMNVFNSSGIKTIADLIDALKSVKRNGIIFLDEIHAINKALQTSLLNCLEDFKLTIKLINKQTITIDVNPFTMIGATTEVGKLCQPFIDRFDISYNMQPYNDDELFTIVKANVVKLELDYDSDETLMKIAQRSRGVPRMANRLLRRVRDYSQVNTENVITSESVDYALSLEGIDSDGFTDLDIQYMKILYKVFGAGPAGKDSIASCLNEDPKTVENVIEPFLVRKGYVTRSKNGRVLTKDGVDWILTNYNED